MNNVEEYHAIMKRYRDGEFGKGPLSLHDILQKAGKENLVNDFSLDDLQFLISSSTGFAKYMFLALKKKKKGG